jgi:transglutaminase-like putative cysteine protease/tetratricopeptide (TPR) repeat protein
MCGHLVEAGLCAYAPDFCYTVGTPMISRLLALSVFLPALSIMAPAQQPAASAKAPVSSDFYRDEPFVFETLDSSSRMHADGTGEATQHVIVRVQSEGTARQFSVLNFAYASANQTAVIDFVRVHKADGSTVETPVADAMDMPAEASREAPVYSDIKEKHLPVRSLAAGDKLEYQYRLTTNTAEAPGQFWGAEHFAVQAGVVLNQTITLEVPATTYVQVWDPKHPATPVTKDGVKTWRWTSSQIKPSQRDEKGTMTAADVKDPDEDSDGRKLPSIAWTTFHDWAQVGDWYRGLIEPRAQPTATIRAKADELTKNAKTPQAQAEALYRFVAGQIRYVSISFGIGRIQPHAADEVLANGYGDCKDKDTLLEALLRSKGFITSPVLIGAGIAAIPDVPSPAVFNHEITTVELPGTGRIWLDSTAEVAPFRVLSPVIRDQEALVLPQKAPASLQKTPADPPYPYTERFDSVMSLNTEGVLKGKITLLMRSDSELVYRTLIRQAAPSQWDQMMQYMSNLMNFGGKVTNADFRQTDPAAPVHVTYDYTREDFADWKNNRIFANFPILTITSIDKDKAPDHDIDLGTPRTLEAHSEIVLPDGDLVDLPSAIHVDRPYTSFDKTYRLQDGTMIADRVVVVKQHKLSKDQWKDYVAFSKAAGLEEGELYATLIPGGVPVSAKASAAPAPSSSDDLQTATLQQLGASTRQAEQQNDWTGARRYAEKAKERFPIEPYVLSSLAYIDAHDKKYDSAIANYKAELAAHPNDGPNIVQLLAGVYMTQKRYGEAVAFLQEYKSRKDVNLQRQLAAAQNLAGDSEGALTTTREAILDHPADKSLQTEEVRLLQHMHRNDEVVIAAKRALDGNNDPNQINSNAYFLVEARKELPLAESSSRRSVEMYDRMTSTGAVEEANARSFALSYQMVFTWDTLGDILLVEDKVKAAEPYFAASWFEQPDTAIANHLGETYERLGRKADALWVTTLALTLPRIAADEDRAAVEARAERLKKEGVQLPTGKPATLQAMRTFQVRNVAKVQGSATVRVQLSDAGILDATIVSGDPALKALLDEVKRIDTPHAVPPASPARVLRDAILFCGKDSKECDFVLMERSGIAQEITPK